MLRSVKVADYMTTQLVTFKPETDLFKAISVFSESNISGAPVVNDRGELIGMLSEVDCLNKHRTLIYRIVGIHSVNKIGIRVVKRSLLLNCLHALV